MITTLHHLYDTSGDAEAYGLALVLSSFSGVASIILLSKVLDLLAKLNCFMQRQAADSSRLPLILDSIEKELTLLKEDGADWCSEVTSTVKKLEDDYQIIVRRGEPVHGTVSAVQSFQSVSQFQVSVAVPYIDCLLANMKSRFSDVAVKLLVSSSGHSIQHCCHQKKDFTSMEKKKSKPWLNFMEVKQECPMMVKPILTSLFLTRMTL